VAWRGGEGSSDTLCRTREERKEIKGGECKSGVWKSGEGGGGAYGGNLGLELGFGFGFGFGCYPLRWCRGRTVAWWIDGLDLEGGIGKKKMMTALRAVGRCGA
jgi:hypothetical protein